MTSVCYTPPLDFIADFDVVGPVCALHKNKLVGEEEWVDSTERFRAIYLRLFQRGGWVEKENVPAWAELIYDQNESWDEFDLRYKFVKFLEMYPVGGGSYVPKTRLYWACTSRSRKKFAQAVMHDTVYGFKLYPQWE